MEIYRERADTTEEILATVGAGQYFGELGPMLNLPRSASARAQTAAHLTGYSVRTFRQRFPTTTPNPNQTRRHPVAGAPGRHPGPGTSG